MKSQPRIAAASGSAPEPMSGSTRRSKNFFEVVCTAQVDAAPRPAAAIAATAPLPATFFATRRQRREASWGGSGTRCGASDGSSSGSSPGSWSSRRATASATIAVSAPAAATPASGLAQRPLPAAKFLETRRATYGMTRLPVPIVRLAMVSLRS